MSRDGDYEVGETRYGFHWGPMFIERVASRDEGLEEGSVAVYLNGLTIHVDKDGKVSHVYSDGTHPWAPTGTPSTPIPEQEATWVNRPEGDRWSWSGPINAIVSDSHKLNVFRMHVWEDKLVVFQEVLRNLYKAGYALVQVGEDSPHG